MTLVLHFPEVVLVCTLISSYHDCKSLEGDNSYCFDIRASHVVTEHVRGSPGTRVHILSLASLATLKNFTTSNYHHERGSTM